MGSLAMTCPCVIVSVSEAIYRLERIVILCSLIAALAMLARNDR